MAVLPMLRNIPETTASNLQMTEICDWLWARNATLNALISEWALNSYYPVPYDTPLSIALGALSG